MIFELFIFILFIPWDSLEFYQIKRQIGAIKKINLVNLSSSKHITKTIK